MAKPDEFARHVALLEVRLEALEEALEGLQVTADRILGALERSEDARLMALFTEAV